MGKLNHFRINLITAAQCTVLHSTVCCISMYCQPLTRVSIPQHEPSEAWGGTGSRHHNGSGFTIATVGPGPLLLLMLPLPYTRQLSHWGGGTGSVTPEWAEWLPLLVPGAGAAPISL